MKLPRDVSADTLIRLLERMGYRIVRQRGSHVRLVHEGTPRHFITVPFHDPLKTGTLHGILSEVCEARSVTVESLLDQL